MKKILFNQSIGILGGGQLGKMMGMVIKQMGFKLVIYDETPNCPASQIADVFIHGKFTDELLLKKFKDCCQIITFEFENIPFDSLQYLLKIGANIPQGTLQIFIAQNRIVEKIFINRLGFKTAPYKLIKNFDELLESIDNFGYPAILKTCTMGYDGKGQIHINNKKDIKKCKPLLQNNICVLEKKINILKECSIICFKSITGEYTQLPLIENIHKNGILFQSILPANFDTDEIKKCTNIAKQFMKKSKFMGTIAIEFFYTVDKEFIINEIAPRPHNSGHLSIEACTQSQFLLHVKSILGIPFNQPEIISPAVMTNILGQHIPAVQKNILLNHKKNIHFHLYGKTDAKKDRKMGHITILDKNIPSILKLGKTIINETK